MDKELALRTFGYLIGYYKSHDEVTINSDEIEAINFILKDNENLEQQNKKQKEVIYKLSKIIYEIDDLRKTSGGYPSYYLDDLLDILKEVSK